MKKLACILVVFMLIVACSKSEDDTPMVAQCEVPTALQTVTIGSNEVTISWNDTNVDETFNLEYGLSGFVQGSGTIVTSTESLITISSLNANTTYDVYVKAICSVTNESMYTSALSFTTSAPAIVPQFLPNLSELNIYSGALNDLTPSIYAYNYELSTPLFSDFAHKQRLIALPQGSSMTYVDEASLPDFPDNTLIAKTFFYYDSEQDQSLGKKIIETRVLIKINGIWESGNYKWNDLQSEAVLDNTTSTVAISYVDANGGTQNVNYKIPSSQDCMTCHGSFGALKPIGPKIRTINFNNQLEDLIANSQLTGAPNPTTLATLPNWLDDTNYSVEQRARAYMDINCAHCHIDGGTCANQSTLRLAYEIPLANSNIFERKGRYRFPYECL